MASLRVANSFFMLNQCHIGDCRDLLKQFAAAGVRAHMCVTSPPYFGLRDYGHAAQIGLEATPNAFVAEMVSVFRGVRDVLADDGTLWLNLGDSYGAASGDIFSGLNARTGRKTGRNKQAAIATALPESRETGVRPKNLLGIPWRVAMALQADGWYLRSDIIWHKPNPMPESVTDRPTKAHEYLFLLAKSERYYYDADAIKEPAETFQRQGTNGLSPKAKAKQAMGHFSDKTGLVDPYAYENRNRRSVWSVATQSYDGAHFATFPKALIEPCILAGSRPGDVVLDPFMGSGTTAQVSEHLGRQWIGCELNPDYMPLQAKRLQQRAMAF
jgi:DNA modification methylase